MAPKAASAVVAPRASTRSNTNGNPSPSSIEPASSTLKCRCAPLVFPELPEWLNEFASPHPLSRAHRYAALLQMNVVKESVPGDFHNYIVTASKLQSGTEPQSAAETTEANPPCHRGLPGRCHPQRRGLVLQTHRLH